MVISKLTLRIWIELLRGKLNDKIQNSNSLLTEDIIKTSQRLDILVSLYQKKLMKVA